jgi:NADPH:quinone reductase-like Zn-dependent oxidoreductase
MIAIRVHRFGDPEVLTIENVPVPDPLPGEALIRVLAAGVGPWDALVRAGKSSVSQDLPLTVGSDIAGIIERLPAGDDNGFALGEEVYGLTNGSFTGGYAQYAIADVSSIARKPRSLDFVAASSVPVIAVTAWKMLFEYASVKAGDTVLVLGGAGNVGSYAVQLARNAGANVIATGSREDADYMRRLGATKTIDYTTAPSEWGISNVDVVIDTAGGNAQLQAFEVLKSGGALISSVSQPSEEKAKEHNARVAFFIVQVGTGDLERIAALIDEGSLKTDVGVVLGLTDARKAHEMLAHAIPHPRGKIVLDATVPEAL